MYPPLFYGLLPRAVVYCLCTRGRGHVLFCDRFLLWSFYPEGTLLRLNADLFRRRSALDQVVERFSRVLENESK